MAESTTMKVYFNSLGVISSTNFADVPLRQGSVGIKLEAYFDEIDNALYTATLNFTRNNGSSVAGLIMNIDNENNECYNYKFDDVWFFAKAGATTLTIFLRDGRGNVLAQGQVTFNIEETDYDDDPLITINQYNSLLNILSGKIGVPQSSLRVDELPEQGQPDIFYIVHDDPSDTTRTNIYLWNPALLDYIWVGSNELDLNKYYTQLEGQAFEHSIEERVVSVENELTSVASGSPKGVYPTLSALEAAYPTGRSGIYLVVADGHWYYWDGTQWSDGGLYLSNEATDPALSFESENLVQNKTVTNAVANLVDNQQATSGQQYTDQGAVASQIAAWTFDTYYEIDKLRKTIFVCHSGGNENYEVFKLCFYNENKENISGTFVNYNIANWGKPLPVPTGAKYFRFCVRKSNSNGSTLSTEYTSEEFNSFNRYVIGAKTIFVDSNYSLTSKNAVENKTVASTVMIKLNADFVNGRYEDTFKSSRTFCKSSPKLFKIANKKIAICHETSASNLYERILVTFYDATETYISWAEKTIDDWGSAIDVPNNAVFVRLGFEHCNAQGQVINTEYTDADFNSFARYTIGIKTDEATIDSGYDPDSKNAVENSVIASISLTKITTPVTVSGRYEDTLKASRLYCRSFSKLFVITNKKIVLWHETETEDIYERFVVTYYDINGSYISWAEKTLDDWGVPLTVPSNAAYVRFGFEHCNSAGSVNMGSEYTEINFNLFTRYTAGIRTIDIEDKFSSDSKNPLENQIISNTAFQRINLDLVVGGYDNGVFNPNAVSMRSYKEFFEIKAKNYVVHHETSVSDLYELMRVYYYDENKTLLGDALNYVFDMYDKPITPPANAKYLTLTFRKCNSSGVASSANYVEGNLFKRYVIGVEPSINSDPVTKYKAQIDKGLTFGYKVTNLNSVLGSKPYFNFLHISDTHASVNARNAVSILNKLKKDGYCKCLIHTGDFSGIRITDGSLSTFLGYLGDAKADVFVVSGNNDVGTTTTVADAITDAQMNADVFTPIFAITPPTNNPSGKNYWYQDYSSEKVRIIGLYEFENDFDIDPTDETKLLYNRGWGSYSQAQITWLLNALSSVPNDYGVIIVKHEPINYRGNTDNPFNAITLRGMNTGHCYAGLNIIADIVQAYIDKTTINRTYSQTGGIVTTLSVVADFSSAHGEFICYLDGHNHSDGVSFLADYPDQLELNIACDNFHNLQNNDSKNVEGTLLQDVLNYVSVDTNKGYLHILRIGNDFSAFASRRDFMSIKYRRD